VPWRNAEEGFTGWQGAAKLHQSPIPRGLCYALPVKTRPSKLTHWTKTHGENTDPLSSSTRALCLDVRISIDVHMKSVPHLVLEQVGEDGDGGGDSIDVVGGEAAAHGGCGGHRHALDPRLEEVQVRQHRHQSPLPQHRLGVLVRQLLQRLHITQRKLYIIVTRCSCQK
jgi:hypothetical protein